MHRCNQWLSSFKHAGICALDVLGREPSIYEKRMVA